MALQTCCLVYLRTMLRNQLAYTATATQIRPSSYITGLVGVNSTNTGAFSKGSRYISTNCLYCCTLPLCNVRKTRRTSVSSKTAALNSECSVKYLRGKGVSRHLISSVNRTMCTIKSDNRICWSCKKNIGEETFFCEICKIIQPPLTELSFFEIFGCQESYVLNVKNLTDRYRKLQSMLHPDKFNNSDEEEKHYSAEQSSFINKAYNILLDPLSRAIYLLSLNDIEIGESNTLNGQDFLMEIMEINEKLSEVKSMNDLDAIRVSNNDSLDSCIESLTEAFENGDLDAAKEFTIRLRYYRNILEIIKDKTMELDD